jgi:hypothetical protein
MLVRQLEFYPSFRSVLLLVVACNQSCLRAECLNELFGLPQGQEERNSGFQGHAIGGTGVGCEGCTDVGGKEVLIQALWLYR